MASFPSSSEAKSPVLRRPALLAAGISVIAHPPTHAPTAHMNTRMVVTTKNWFGGGGDLTPMLAAARTPVHDDTRDFHAAFKSACDAHDAEYYPRFKPSATIISFCLTARKRAAPAAFSTTTSTRATGKPILPSRRMSGAPLLIFIPKSPPAGSPTFTEEDRKNQMRQRGRYVEFNLLYDRGTMFGLKNRRQCRQHFVFYAAQCYLALKSSGHNSTAR